MPSSPAYYSTSMTTITLTSPSVLGYEVFPTSTLALQVVKLVLAGLVLAGLLARVWVGRQARSRARPKDPRDIREE